MEKSILAVLAVVVIFASGLAIGYTQATWEATKTYAAGKTYCEKFVNESTNRAVKKDKMKYYMQCLDIQQGE